MTEITVKLFPYYPDDMWIGGYIVENFHKGLDCIREIMAKGYKPSVVRLYDKPDVDHNYGSVKLKDEEAFNVVLNEYRNTIYCTLICNKGHLRFADAPCVYGRNACECQNFIGSASFLHLPL